MVQFVYTINQITKTTCNLGSFIVYTSSNLKYKQPSTAILSNVFDKIELKKVPQCYVVRFVKLSMCPCD